MPVERAKLENLFCLYSVKAVNVRVEGFENPAESKKSKHFAPP